MEGVVLLGGREGREEESGECVLRAHRYARDRLQM